MTIKTTSLKVDEVFWLKVKIYAISHKISISDLVARSLENEMKR